MGFFLLSMFLLGNFTPKVNSVKTCKVREAGIYIYLFINLQHAESIHNKFRLVVSNYNKFGQEDYISC